MHRKWGTLMPPYFLVKRRFASSRSLPHSVSELCPVLPTAARLLGKITRKEVS